MNRYAAAAVIWGFALGAVAYRYGMLPFLWASPWRHVLPGLAVGLVVVGKQLVRYDAVDAKRPALPLLLALGVVGGVLAFGVSYVAFPTLARAGLSKRELPGFSISLPSGDVAENRPDYNNGKLVIKNAANSKAVAFIQWELGDTIDHSQLQMVADLMSKALGVRGNGELSTIPGPDGKPVDAVTFVGDDMMFVMSLLPCGVRHVAIAVAGPSEVIAMQKRIVATFACHPDPSRETTAAIRFPLVLDMPQGWAATSREIDQIEISDGASAMVLRTTAPHFDVDLSLLAEPMFKAMGVQGHVTKRDGKRIWMTLSDGSDSMEGLIRLVPCPDATAMVLAIAADEATLADLDSRVGRARCLHNGEAAQVWPDAPPNEANKVVSPTPAP